MEKSETGHTPDIEALARGLLEKAYSDFSIFIEDVDRGAMQFSVDSLAAQITAFCRNREAPLLEALKEIATSVFAGSDYARRIAQSAIKQHDEEAAG